MKNNHQFLSSNKNDAHKRKLVLFFCLTVYIVISGLGGTVVEL